MPRSIWNGTITFGLIAVPIKVHSATESHTIHFHQVHGSDGARIKQKRICSKEDKEVPYKEVAKGYEVAAASSSCSTRTRSTRRRATVTHDRDRAVRRPRPGRPGLLQPHLLPGGGRRRRGRLSAAARCARAL